MSIILLILLILGLSRLVGELMERFRQPALVGEITVGIVLGPAVLAFISPSVELEVLAEVATFFIVFAAGIEFSLDQVKTRYFNAILTAFMANNVAFFSGFTVGMLFGYSPKVSFFIGTVFSLTALPVALRVLSDLKMDKTEFGRSVITIAIFDDLFSMFLIALVLPLSASQDVTFRTLFDISVKLAVFMAMIFAIRWFFRWRNERAAQYMMHYLRKLRSREAEFAVLLLMGLSFGLLGEYLGITWIIGAFYGGALIGENLVGERVYRKVNVISNSITYGLLAPIFFVYIGINFDVDLGRMSLPTFLMISVAFVAVAFLSKTVGAYIGARLAGVRRRSAEAIGLALNSRGLMGLVIAGFGMELGIISKTVFSLLVIVCMVTTLMTPFFLKRALSAHPEVGCLEEKHAGEGSAGSGNEKGHIL